MLLKVDCLPNAVGKQPSIPLIYLGRKWTVTTDDDDVFAYSVFAYYFNNCSSANRFIVTIILYSVQISFCISNFLSVCSHHIVRLFPIAKQASHA